MKAKKVITTFLAATLLLTSSSLVFADNHKENRINYGKIEGTKSQEDKIKISYETINYDKNNIKITMRIPSIDGLKDVDFQKNINKIIRESALSEKENFVEQAILENAKRKRQGYSPLNFEFNYNYEVRNTHKVLSLLIKKYKYNGGANGESFNEYYNIDIKESKLLKLDDLFKKNSNHIDRINEEIRELISKEPDKYFTGNNGFKTISSDQQFFIEDGNLIIAFQKYSIAPGSTGIPMFKISLKDLDDILVDSYLAYKDYIYVNKEYDFTFLLPSSWEDKVNIVEKSDLEDYIIEGYEFDDIEFIVDFVYRPNNKVKKDANLLSIIVLEKDEYDSLSKTLKDKLGRLLGEKEDFVYLGKIYSNPYSSKSLEYTEFQLRSSDIQGRLDRLFKFIDEEYKEDKDDDSKEKNKEKDKNREKDKSNKNLDKYKWVYINGKRENLNKLMYKNENGNLMIPVAKVSRELGYKVKWNPQNNTITLDGDKAVTITINSKKYSTLNSTITLKGEAKIINGTAFVPVDFFEKLLELNVDIDSEGMLNIYR